MHRQMGTKTPKFYFYLDLGCNNFSMSVFKADVFNYSAFAPTPAR